MSLAELFDRLQTPEFYPHATVAPIALIQTHISAVFLTGEFAYKLKKPVNFGFLDYSTLEKRHYFLDRELQMNRQTAPDLYLEVLPVTRDRDRLCLAGSGKVVDYVLKMRQFPQDALLSHRFDAGQLGLADMEELGRVVARFHQQTPTNDTIREFGRPEKLAIAIAENYEQTEKYVGIAQTQRQFAETRAFTDDFLTNKADLFRDRQAKNKIRECHGDLHLNNICLWQDKFQLFDRIEFNEDFRFVDVAFDIAFTIVDLDARQRPDLGNRFLNTYLEETGDWESVQVLPFYLCRQAYVRAKVTSMLLDDPQIREADKTQAIATARNYYRLAWQYAQPQKGQLILMSGLSGSGKSTVAQFIAARLNAIHLRSDAVRKHLAGIPLHQRGDNDLYSPEMTARTYRQLVELGQMLADRGQKVILDAKFDRRLWRDMAISAASDRNLPLHIVHCTAPLSVLRDRLAKRQGDISDARADLLDAQKQQAEPFSESERSFVLTLDTEQPPSTWSDRLAEILPRAPSGDSEPDTPDSFNR